MCIICIKPQNTDLPNYQTRLTMWLNNPDGAGIMYAYAGNVYIDKGFMNFEDMENHLTHLGSVLDLAKIPMVLHYRIATHGSIDAPHTHPFPCADSAYLLRGTRVITRLGIAHNGIISIKPRRGYSDTMEYIAQTLAHLPDEFYTDPHALDKIAHDVGACRLAFLANDGYIARVGNWIKTMDGLQFSNSSYIPRKLSAKYLETLWGVGI